jgi:ATP-binding cassette subfamily C protein
VALLRRGSSYEIVDPEARTRVRVDERSAAKLAPHASMLYRPLPETLRRPWQLMRVALRGKALDVTFILGLSILITLIGMLTPQAMAIVMDNAIPDANLRLLLELGMALVAVSVGAALFEVAQGLVSIRIAISSDATTQTALWDRLLNLRVSFFKRHSTGDLLDRAMTVSEVNQELNGATISGLLTAIMALLNLGLLFYYSSKLAYIAVALGIAVAIVTTLGGYLIRRYTRILMELRGKFFGFVVEMVSAVGKIRVAGAERHAFARWARKYAEQLHLIRKAQAIEDYVIVFNEALPTISSALLFWFGVSLLTGESTGKPLTVGVFLAFNVAMGSFLRGATTLSETLVQVLETTVKSKRIQPILDAEQEVSESQVDPGRLQGAVAITGVDFRYSEEGPKILDDVSIEAGPGEFVALVGPSGSGKSTLFRLLLGFEIPEVGSIAFDGQDFKGLDIHAVRRQMGVVLQGGRIGSGSIFDNIGAGATISLEDAWDAAEGAGFAGDIREMPMGIHTMVSEGGTNFSGGQCQRLLISRALVMKPKILLMDEATSALDNKSQAIVKRSLDRRKVTRLVIAHRLSTIRNANRIYVLDQGRVAEYGTFDELIGREGLFASMMARQMA